MIRQRARVLAISDLSCLLLFLVPIFQSGCAFCSGQLQMEVTSPDGRFEAVVYARECGATSWYTTEVSILPLGAAVKGDWGNIMTADDHDGQLKLPLTGVGVLKGMEVRWASNRELVVSYPAAAEVGKKQKLSQGITITYVAR